MLRTPAARSSVSCSGVSAQVGVHGEPGAVKTDAVPGEEQKDVGAGVEAAQVLVHRVAVRGAIICEASDEDGQGRARK
jgi:hypothetical protein